jgi:hypothetical protein
MAARNESLMPTNSRLPSEIPHSAAPRRLPTVAAGLAVAVLAGGAFASTYDLLREFALAGRADDRWAPAYPVMVDALVVIVFLSLLVARDAPWWSRWLRGALLLALIAGTAAIAVQHALWGFGSLPETPHRTGVAVAPHAMLVLAIWLWYRMIKRFRPRTRPAAAEPTPKEPEPTDPTEPIEAVAAEPAPEPPSPAPPALLPTDIEVARDLGGEGAAPSDSGSGRPASTTRPDMIMPISLDKEPDAATERKPDDDDPDATDPNGVPQANDEDFPIWNWDPPSSTYRSSPTPPED